MKSRLFPFLILLCATLFAQNEVQFGPFLPKVGQTFVRTSTYKMDVDVVLKFAGESLADHNDLTTSTVRKAETILQLEGDSVRKLKVTYEIVDRKTVITEDDIPETKKLEKSPVLGRTYIVTTENKIPKVTDENGFKPSNAEIDIVQLDYEDMGPADNYAEVLKNKAVKIGEPIQMPGIVAEGIFRDAEHRQFKVDQASFVLRSVRQNLAVFDTDLKMLWNQDANTSIKMFLSGETLVNVVNSQMVSSSLSGTVRVTGAEQYYDRLAMADGKGKITITQKVQTR